jgi:hypothetical protein
MILFRVYETLYILAHTTLVKQLLFSTQDDDLQHDPSSGFEEVKEVELEPFLGQVVVLDTIEALQQAQESMVFDQICNLAYKIPRGILILTTVLGNIITLAFLPLKLVFQRQ